MTGDRTPLRERLIDAIRRDQTPGPTVTSAADAVLPVVEAETAALRERAEKAEAEVAQWRRDVRTYAHNEGEQRKRAEQAEQELRAVEIDRDEWRNRAHHWKAAVERVRALHAPEEDPRRVRDCKGCRTVATFRLYDECKTLAALEPPKETP